MQTDYRFYLSLARTGNPIWKGILLGLNELKVFLFYKLFRFLLIDVLYTA